GEQLRSLRSIARAACCREIAPLVRTASRKRNHMVALEWSVLCPAIDARPTVSREDEQPDLSPRLGANPPDWLTLSRRPQSRPKNPVFYQAGLDQRPKEGPRLAGPVDR